ncbi:glycoside hydrolase family 3 N-terminal domain-containing protein [Fundicoccus culcitae]|uniref:beta-glucosidase n=1 Tax=Fundicoccus culcitae TaxID=2969821 RepID=A0ABY5P5M4_9LACT|nr:glycoside hydrolase family 3 N-terminal domain-containing protein [Fundicoccus culcitae]UUX33871.1 glycoside hydrolase family 3 C-terminal domain-containing protein [Fundicoccus culcitae]
MEQTKLLALLDQMTLEEKVGQLVQLTPMFFSEQGEVTGPMNELEMTKEELFQIGSVLGTRTKEDVISIQTTYLANSRLKIPLIFMADVIHGYETIFPIPLALASSFDTELVKTTAELSAFEATRAGVHVTFSPMADLVRDARWGRVLESNGEDPYLSSQMTRAYVEGYQGEILSDKDTLAACVKHFVGYGEAEAGRDYNTVDMSDLNLYQNHLPAFRAAIDAGVKLVMSSFNVWRGIPSTANKYLLKDVLRNEMHFEGLVIADYAAVHELINHRVAADKKEAAYRAFSAGVEIDMVTDYYQHALPELIQDGLIEMDQLNQSVLKMLELKNELGLFEDPYRGLKDETLDRDMTPLRAKAREIAGQSMVLLKNESILPIQPSEKIGLVGPKANSHDVLGAWSWIGNPDKAITLEDGLKQAGFNPTYVEREIDYVQLKYCDKVIVAVGEISDEGGEGASKTSIALSQRQVELIKEVYHWNQNIIVVLVNSRPMDLSAIQPYVKGILVSWFPGSEAGIAIVDVLSGRVNPSAKLPMTFPQSTGQLPMSYNFLSTGRGINEHNHAQKYVSRYLDSDNAPLYPFGFGLNYSQIELDQVKISQIDQTTVEIKYQITNHSENAGSEILQVYMQDKVTEVARPERELKYFEKIHVAAKETVNGMIRLGKDDLSYWHADLSFTMDPGAFDFFVGFDSHAPLAGTWTYVE